MLKYLRSLSSLPAVLLTTSCVTTTDTPPAEPRPLVLSHSATNETITASIFRKGGVVNAADYPNLQVAIDALPIYGGIVFMPPGTYKLDKPLNLSNTYNTGDKTRWITLQGSGKLNTTIIGNFPGSVVVDATRAGFLTMRDFTIAGRAKCLLLLARDKKELGGGGGNFFENLMIRGDDCEVAVMDRSGEVNRFFNCDIYVNKPNATCLWFTPHDPLKIRSPYLGETGACSTTELRLYGTGLQTYGLNSVGLRVDGCASDISVIGGYFHNSGFAAIYLDGTKGNVGEVQVRDLRIEGERGMYDLYAKGSVNRVSITGGAWGSAGECIRYEDVPETERFDSNAAADGWSIVNLGAYIGDHSAIDPSVSTGSRYFDGPGGRAVIRLDKMRNCRMENIVYPGNGYRIVKKGAATTKSAPKTQQEREAAQVFALKESDTEFKNIKPKLLVCEKNATANTIMTQDRSDVVFLGVDQGNQITALNDDGVRRTYFGGGARPEVQNFPALDAKAIDNPKSGDFALLKRGDGTVAPAYYDGKAWKFLAFQP